VDSDGTGARLRPREPIGETGSPGWITVPAFPAVSQSAWYPGRDRTTRLPRNPPGRRDLP